MLTDDTRIDPPLEEPHPELVWRAYLLLGDAERARRLADRAVSAGQLHARRHGPEEGDEYARGRGGAVVRARSGAVPAGRTTGIVGASGPRGLAGAVPSPGGGGPPWLEEPVIAWAVYQVTSRPVRGSTAPERDEGRQILGVVDLSSYFGPTRRRRQLLALWRAGPT